MIEDVPLTAVEKEFVRQLMKSLRCHCGRDIYQSMETSTISCSYHNIAFKDNRMIVHVDEELAKIADVKKRLKGA